MMKMNKINIGALAAALLLACTALPSLAQDAFGPLLENDLKLNTMEGVTGRVRAAFDGSRYLAVWSQVGDPDNASNMTPGLWGQFLTANGVKDGPILEIYADPPLPESNPDIAWNGSYFVVAWRNQIEIQALRVDVDGGIPGSAFTVSLMGTGHVKEDPAITSNGEDFFVTWNEVNDLNVIRGMQFATYDVGNPSYKSLMDISTGGYANIRPTVSYGNTNTNKFFVTWSRQETMGEDYDLYGAFITPGEQEPDSVFSIADGPGNQGGSIPAGNVFDETNFIVTYGDDDGGTTKVKAVTVSPEGYVGTPLEIADASGLSGTDIALGPLEWFVVWGADGFAKGARVRDSIEVLDPEGVNISADNTHGAQPSALFAGENYLVFFEGFSTFDKYAQLVGYGLPPEEQIAEILEFIDNSVESGTLVGSGSGGSADHRLDALMKMIETASALIEEGDIDGACDQLLVAYRKTDGNPIPPDFVAGSAASELASMIDELRQSLGCE